MNTLEIPKLPSRLILEPALTDEEFEQMSMANELVKLERTKEGKIVVNPPTGLDSSSGNTEITRQLGTGGDSTERAKSLIPTPVSSFLTDLPSARTEPTRRLNRFRVSPAKTAGTSGASRRHS